MLSVIVPAHNEEKYIINCINSIMQQICNYEFELIVVNNASTDATVDLVKNLNVRLVEQPKKGIATARNTGALHSKYNNLLFIDADCILPSDHLQKVCETFIQNPELAAFGGPYIYKDGGKFVNMMTEKFRYFYHLSNLFKTVFKVAILSGGNFAIRKRVFVDLGGFNENLTSPLEVEDLELCVRMAKRGYQFHMDNTLPLISSFRRQMRASMLKDSFVRFSNTLKCLTLSKNSN